MKIGNFEILTCVSDRFRLDGGAMFGSVPKTLWSRSIAADEANRIQLACRLLVLRSSTQLVVVDLGMGNKWSEKERGIYAVENILDVSQTFEAASDVILTHMHFDHAGGITKRNKCGELELSIPKARYYLSRKNLEHASAPNLRERASYLAENIDPLKTGLPPAKKPLNLHLTSDGEEILPGVRSTIADGHTHGLQVITVSDGSKTVVYPSDVIPTSHHIPLPYVMGYDLSAERSMLEKEALLRRAVKERWIVVFEHDPEIAAATVIQDDAGRFRLGEVVELPKFVG